MTVSADGPDANDALEQLAGLLLEFRKQEEE
jgi:phosphotransferase system HPr-like phosphotransfer protein